MIKLNQDRKRYLRRLGHELKPVVLMGGAGLTEAVMAEIERALYDHELIKVKVVADDRDERSEYVARISEATDAALVQRIGNIALLYRPHPEPAKRRIPMA